MTIVVVVELVRLVLSYPLWVPLPLLLYSRGRCYKEDNRVGYNMISIRTLSLLACFTYISIDIIIYALGSTSWSSEIFWMVGQVVTDPSLGLSSPCEVVPQVLIPVNAEVYLDWEMTIDNKFSSHLVHEQHRVRQVTSEFKDFAIIWWNELSSLHLQYDTWDRLKAAMHERFVPPAYQHDLRKKLQRLD
jgi:hypothetical protein